MIRAQQQDIAPPDLISLAREIETLEQRQKQGKLSEKNSLLGQIQTAASSGPAAANFYTKAVEEVQFKGKKDKPEAFADWKKSHDDMLRSKEMQTALVLHLKYLLLSLQRKGLEKPETQLPAITAYINELVGADDLFFASPAPPDPKKKGPPKDEWKGLLDNPLIDDKKPSRSVFVEWLRLEEWLPEAKNWEFKPGDLAGILDKNVRSVLRDKRDPQLIPTWDMQMKVEAERITSGRLAHKADEFNTVTKPRMLFKRAQDMAVIGQPNRGLVEVVALVRAYPSHPDFPAWLDYIRGALKK
ncbi:MAG: hypothetical protein D4R65_12660 [Verrucomicrobiaceae bacterium]|nr:MAG: hypothetical protein D4R65_12660 [Verrucomicrobiaceae bacterium]